VEGDRQEAIGSGATISTTRTDVTATALPTARVGRRGPACGRDGARRAPEGDPHERPIGTIGGRFAEREAGLPKTGAFRGVAAADVNGDGRPDLVWTTPTSAFVALNRGDGTFLPAREIAAGGEPLLFDFDNDGAL
jgi:hypothetical protein